MSREIIRYIFRLFYFAFILNKICKKNSCLKKFFEDFEVKMEQYNSKSNYFTVHIVSTKNKT
jgi:hypothetical protein